ncbi:unnamed protein product [Calicophoron daubneyi]|uniref:Receptor expression-enhancing protein n=1 Tax=Calicophoron daubneyi TaxID=300641 RepID=A0AAV2SZW9_CALDB
MFQKFHSELKSSLSKENAFTRFLAACEAKSGVNRIVIVYIALAVLFLYLIIGHGTDVLVLFVGFLYPAYQSIKAIESHEKGDDTQWLVYWVVFVSLQLFEVCTLSLVYYIPLYSFLKCLFLLHCMAPFRENGSWIVYNKIIRPAFLKHSSAVDSALDSAAGMAKQVVNDVVRKQAELMTAN